MGGVRQEMGRGMLGTHLQGPHQSVCWLRPKRARHFLGEPGSERNVQHAKTREEQEEKEVKGQREDTDRGVDRPSRKHQLLVAER